MSIANLFSTMVFLFASMAIGYAGAKFRFIDHTFNKQLTNFLIYLIHPCMVLSSVLNTKHLLTNLQVLQLLGIAICCYAFLIPVSLLIAKLLRIPKADVGTYRFAIVFSNIGFVGYPVVESLFGADAKFYVTLFILVFQLVVYTLGVHLLTESDQKFHLNKSILLKPMVITPVIALVIYMLDLRVPDLLAGTVNYIGDISTPISMIIIGCSLAECSLRQILGSPRTYAMILVKMILIPILVNALLRPLLGDSLLLGITIVILAMPVASNTTILSLAYGGNEKLASSAVFTSTIISMVSVPAIMWLLFGA